MDLQYDPSIDTWMFPEIADFFRMLYAIYYVQFTDPSPADSLLFSP
jgi:hypothetical protein